MAQLGYVHSRQDNWDFRKGSQSNGRYDTEGATTSAPESPEQILVLIIIGSNVLPLYQQQSQHCGLLCCSEYIVTYLCCHHFEFQNVIHRHPFPWPQC